jgi:hypothetical protein
LTAADGTVPFGVGLPRRRPVNDHADRELTYRDPDAETALDADGGPPTEADAARFLLDLYDRSPDRLYLGAAVSRLLEEYRGWFLTHGRDGFTVAAEVVTLFGMLAGPDVVFDKGDRCWRLRYSWER